mmetsp:Transcript_37364/g.38777  ORF Transcript_37364/g.38777 Transcript_37364/m.38777 type:complete len:98 (-) Transcript_37364:84-377(-)
MVWLTIRLGETADGHSGYEFPWTPYRLLFFSTGQEFHNYHHLMFDGNYGSFFTIWDRLFGTTNKGFLTYINKEYEKGSEEKKLKTKEDSKEIKEKEN